MEKIVRIMSQSPLATRQYTDRKTGVEKVMNSVALHLTDGVDNFIAEITGERAVNLPVLTKARRRERRTSTSTKSAYCNEEAGENVQVEYTVV